MFTFENLVVLKSALTVTKEHTVFRANHFYRCLPETEMYLINGEMFDKREYDSLFETAHERVLRDFKTIGILGENNKPISKTAFAKKADIHTYGSGKNALKIWFFRNSRECIYGFYPSQGKKAYNLEECYKWYLDIINGNMECVDSHDVMFGNCGVPISYSELRIM